ncbi:PREDICTED: transient receptor potential cation channel subfamily V member 4-like [Branchiostoma belcheri]|uniref:Transient receptor potential cation channel subfamily V member 4-like n=1 Tax=Branchiostoma belcheri TaxID=7741 RepID=A0A6P4ZFC4_BRABE|nr:PREDICTED: transient receptor potential cation channel subfamily V member 4-like [Branchiostoma belcheri]
MKDLYEAILQNNERLALRILSEHAEYATMACEDPDHYGESPLHLAIFNGNLTLVKKLVSRGADPNARCTGTRFSHAKGTEEDVLCYYGEYALSLAACLGMEKIVEYLVKKGARLDNKDTEGNTVLHVLASMEQTDASMAMVKLVLKLSQGTESLETIENKEDLTPVKLAATSGNLEMFQFLIDHSHRHCVLWRYGHVFECLYGLSDIDIPPTDDATLTVKRGYSLLEVAIYSDIHRFYTNIKADQMIQATPIKQLLEKKWRRMRKWFWGFAVAYLIHIIIFTACYLHRPLRSVETVLNNGTHNVTLVHVEKLSRQEWYESPGLEFGKRITAGIIGILITVMVFETFEHYSMKTGTYFFGYGVGNGPFQFVRFDYGHCTCVRMDVAAVLRAGHQTSGAVHGHHFSAFYITFEQAKEDLEQFRNLENTMMTLFKLTLGLEDVTLTVLNKAPNPALAISLYVSFLIFSFLLMANMLIAMMGETLSMYSDGWENLWELQRAYLIIQYEQSYHAYLRIVFYFLPRPELKYYLLRLLGEYVDMPGIDPKTRYLRVKIRGKPKNDSEVKLSRRFPPTMNFIEAANLQTEDRPKTRNLLQRLSRKKRSSSEPDLDVPEVTRVNDLQ